MPLIEVTQSQHLSATIRLESSTAKLVDQYAAFVHGSADDVIDKALNCVFAKDRDFQVYLKYPKSANVPRSLRVRRIGAEPVANGKAPVGGVETRRELSTKSSLAPENTPSVLRTG
jgi:hypothetical protein